MRIIAALFLLCLMSSQALACSCTVDAFGPQASRNNIARAKFIVQGRVTYVAPEDKGEQKTSKGMTPFGITVAKILKGDDLKMLAAYADTSTKCGTSVENLKRQDFFVLYEAEGKLMLAQMCTNFISAKDRIALMQGNYKP